MPRAHGPREGCDLGAQAPPTMLHLCLRVDAGVSCDFEVTARRPPQRGGGDQHFTVSGRAIEGVREPSEAGRAASF